ncbi:type II toxin-antitoxin system HicA family toxin [Aliarcobacter skirrowii]|uniref:type II toxin-antitoxin system HicA family toxin n=1 Tax=Aliarcobacter skirrowii TaxID=28200 RepID=UPI002A364174|nr:type II toxin-antitoxin system HicA family toxin [Aliarcobacter skirrowii]MDY0181416.1 type II toxin-antitoxin system HicA family toxin [Aliarcobacter skirrowii]
MASLTNITGKKLISYITSIGYEFERQNRGNHRIYVHETKKTLTIPVYKKKVVKIGLLGGILRDIGISKTEFLSSIN